MVTLPDFKSLPVEYLSSHFGAFSTLRIILFWRLPTWDLEPAGSRHLTWKPRAVYCNSLMKPSQSSSRLSVIQPMSLVLKSASRWQI